MTDRPLTYRESLFLLIGIIAFLIFFIGGIEYVRHCTQLCNDVPAVMMNACLGR